MKRILCLIPVLLLISCQLQTADSQAPVLSGSSRTPGEQPVALPPTVTPTLDPQALAFMQRPQGGVLRVMTYNVNWDSIFLEGDELNHGWRLGDRSAAFRRILQAVRPDVVCLQEINPLRPPSQTAAIFDEALPLPGGGHWDTANAKDDIILSSLPLVREGYQLPDRVQAAARIDLPEDVFGSGDLYVICAHFKSGGGAGDIAHRQSQADAVIAQLRDALTLGGSIDLPARTHIILLGDFNVYDTDPALHLTTLLSGDIAFESLFGPDFPPDWDGSSLADALPFQNGMEEFSYTWRNDQEPFNPGALDRILYSDSSLRIVNSFVLNTMSLTHAELAALGLQAGDVMVQPALGNYDHLPVVVDFIVIVR